MVSGSEPGEALIELVRPSTVSIDGPFTSDDADIQGRGRAVGVLLQQTGVPQPALLAAVAFNLCPERACEPVAPNEFVSGTTVMDDSGAQTVPLPAGRYRVVLIADGAPATARLRLDGLRRPTSLTPSAPAGVSYSKVEPSLRAPADVATVAYSGGRSYDATPDGAIILFQELFRTVAGAAQVAGTCIIGGPPPPADAYAPGCLTLDRGSNRVEFVSPVSVADPNEVLVVGYGNGAAQPKQQTSVGHYLLAAAPVQAVDVTQIEIPIRIAPQGARAATPGTVAPPADGAPTPATAAGGGSGTRGVTARPATSGPSGGTLPATGTSGTAALAALVLLGLAAAATRTQRSSRRRSPG